MSAIHSSTKSQFPSAFSRARVLAITLGVAVVGGAFYADAKDPAPLPKPSQKALIASTGPSRSATPRAVPPPEIVAKAAVAIDINSGRIFYEKNADGKREVASTQKLMTALLVCEKGDLDGLLTVERADTLVVPSKLYLRTGEEHPRATLLRTLMVKSANDVACCLARDNAGSVEAFIARMNDRARTLGMKDSNFMSANGLSVEGQYSTARDMAKLARAAYRQPVIRDAVITLEMQFRHNHGRIRTLGNTNRLLWSSPYCTGLKTGFTNAAGRCLISSGQHEGAEVIVVVLGSNSKSVWKDSQTLLHWTLGIDETKNEAKPATTEKTG